MKGKKKRAPVETRRSLRALAENNVKRNELHSTSKHLPQEEPEKCVLILTLSLLCRVMAEELTSSTAIAPPRKQKLQAHQVSAIMVEPSTNCQRVFEHSSRNFMISSRYRRSAAQMQPS